MADELTPYQVAILERLDVGTAIGTVIGFVLLLYLGLGIVTRMRS